MTYILFSTKAMLGVLIKLYWTLIEPFTACLLPASGSSYAAQHLERYK